MTVAIAALFATATALLVRPSMADATPTIRQLFIVNDTPEQLRVTGVTAKENVDQRSLDWLRSEHGVIASSKQRSGIVKSTSSSKKAVFEMTLKSPSRGDLFVGCTIPAGEERTWCWAPSTPGLKAYGTDNPAPGVYPKIGNFFLRVNHRAWLSTVDDCANHRAPNGLPLPTTGASARWMRCLREAGGGALRLSEMVIPGAHDAGTREPTGDVSTDSNACGQDLGGLDRPLVTRWARTQTASLVDLAEHGVRYFDLRMTTRGDKWRFCHTAIFEEVEPALSALVAWVKDHPGEVLFLDLRPLPASDGAALFDPDSFVAVLQRSGAAELALSSAEHPPTYSVGDLTLADMDRFGKQLILLYTRRGYPAMHWRDFSLPVLYDTDAEVNPLHGGRMSSNSPMAGPGRTPDATTARFIRRPTGAVNGFRTMR